MARAGVAVSTAMCEHLALSRAELFAAVQVQRAAHLQRDHRPVRNRSGLRHLQAGGRLDPRLALRRAHPRRGPGRAAGHQRPGHGQPAEGRHLLGGAAHAGRRDPARAAGPHRPGGPGLRALHEDHRRPADRPVRCPARAAAGHLGAARRRRDRVRPRLRQGAAHGEVVRRLVVVPLRRAGLGRHGRARSSCATAACAARTSSSWGSPGAPASAPRRAARTSASSRPTRAGTSTWAATAGSPHGTPSCSSRTSTTRPRSRSSTATSCTTCAPPTGCSARRPGSEEHEGGLDRIREIVVDDALGIGADLDGADGAPRRRLRGRVGRGAARPRAAAPVLVVRQRPATSPTRRWRTSSERGQRRPATGAERAAGGTASGPVLIASTTLEVRS